MVEDTFDADAEFVRGKGSQTRISIMSPTCRILLCDPELAAVLVFFSSDDIVEASCILRFVAVLKRAEFAKDGASVAGEKRSGCSVPSKVKASCVYSTQQAPKSPWFHLTSKEVLGNLW